MKKFRVTISIIIVHISCFRKLQKAEREIYQTKLIWENILGENINAMKILHREQLIQLNETIQTEIQAGILNRFPCVHCTLRVCGDCKKRKPCST